MPRYLAITSRGASADGPRGSASGACIELALRCFQNDPPRHAGIRQRRAGPAGGRSPPQEVKADAADVGGFARKARGRVKVLLPNPVCRVLVRSERRAPRGSGCGLEARETLRTGLPLEALLRRYAPCWFHVEHSADGRLASASCRRKLRPTYGMRWMRTHPERLAGGSQNTRAACPARASQP